MVGDSFRFYDCGQRARRRTCGFPGLERDNGDEILVRILSVPRERSAVGSDTIAVGERSCLLFAAALRDSVAYLHNRSVFFGSPPASERLKRRDSLPVARGKRS